MKCEESSVSLGSWQICSFFHHLPGNRIIINPPLCARARHDGMCVRTVFFCSVCDIFSVACGDATISILQYVGQLVARRERDDAKAKKRKGGGSEEQQRGEGSESELPLDIWQFNVQLFVVYAARFVCYYQVTSTQEKYIYELCFWDISTAKTKFDHFWLNVYATADWWPTGLQATGEAVTALSQTYDALHETSEKSPRCKTHRLKISSCISLKCYSAAECVLF